MKPTPEARPTKEVIVRRGSAALSARDEPCGVEDEYGLAADVDEGGQHRTERAECGQCNMRFVLVALSTVQFRVDIASDIGLADQIAGQVRRALGEGRLSAGDRLPPAREVAAGLDINMHTVLRAYGVLRDEGVIDLRRGRGAHVRPDAEPGAVALRHQIHTLVREAQRLGINADQLVALVREAQTS